MSVITQKTPRFSEAETTELDRIVRTALAEDMGSGDITSELSIPEDSQAVMSFIAGEDLLVCGSFIPQTVFDILSPKNIKIKIFTDEGTLAKSGSVLATATGNARILLAGERVVLNLMQRMSGVATLTNNYVKAIASSKASILDTRKTMPGLRILDKYAVRTGGGKNHRMRLDDMVLIKDNHIALGGASGIRLYDVVSRMKERYVSLYGANKTLPPIVVECDSLDQVQDVLAAKPDRILLDNMTIEQLKSAVAMTGGKVPLEASGGVSLATITEIAKTGVDYISVGKITHSAPAVDIRADINSLS